MENTVSVSNVQKIPGCESCRAGKRHGRLSLAYIFHSFRQDIIGAERGLFLTIWHLFIAPQRVVNAFIKGDDLRYYSPVKYFTVMLAVSIFLVSNTPVLDHTIAYLISKNGLAPVLVARKIVADWNALLYLPVIFIIALSTRIFFRRSGLNYAEHLVVATYSWSQLVLVGAAAYLLVKFLIWLDIRTFSQIILLVFTPAYWLWYCRSVFAQAGIMGYLRSIVALPLAVVIYLFLVAFVIGIFKWLMPLMQHFHLIN